jgi:hypothetical protein
MEVIEVEYPVSHHGKYNGQYHYYRTMTSKYPNSVGGIWYFLDETKKKCQELGYPGIFLYEVIGRQDVPVGDRLEGSVYIRWDFIKERGV